MLIAIAAGACGARPRPTPAVASPVAGDDEVLAGPVRPLDVAALDAFIDDARARLAVPGAAVAITRDGEVIYQHVVGVRRLGEPAPITVDTRFLLGSVTKPLTTLMEAALVDAGVVRWDDRVTTLLPGFALADAALTARLELWHMSCACSGVGAQDLDNIFEGEVGPEARLAAMATMRPTAALGATYQYSNLMVAAGGYAAAHAAEPARGLGDAYAAVMQRTVFDPIGMTATTLALDAVERGDHASPHALALDGTTRAMPVAIEGGVRSIAPAGAAWSTVRDVARYVATEAARGVAPGGRRVVSAANVEARWRRRIADGDGPDSGYGLGVGVDRYHGVRLLGHDGGAFGFGTTVAVLPDLGVGVVILTNVRNGGAAEQLPFNAVVERAVLEALLVGARPEAAARLTALVQARAEADAAAGQGVELAPPPSWAAGLAGTYRDPRLGDVVVRPAVHGGSFDAGEWRSDFGRRARPDGVVELVLVDPPFAGTGLAIEGDAAHLRIVVPDALVTYRLERVGP
ncbi:MAG: beta-lactamase family protein [Myxococcales bacterium]|nr:beta-lactamase family protein [Myxococcales bacterium]